MGAVACADTVNLGYGMYGSTSPMVKAVEVMHVPTDAKLVIMSKAKCFWLRTKRRLMLLMLI